IVMKLAFIILLVALFTLAVVDGSKRPRTIVVRRRCFRKDRESLSSSFSSSSSSSDSDSHEHRRRGHRRYRNDHGHHHHHHRTYPVFGAPTAVSAPHHFRSISSAPSASASHY
ncbi:hypothetical protein PFISCL1PPCAC_27112, partial [Pristionchus fissidentatus]